MGDNWKNNTPCATLTCSRFHENGCKHMQELYDTGRHIIALSKKCEESNTSIVRKKAANIIGGGGSGLAAKSR